VLIAVSSTQAQMLDRNLYRVAGIEPEGTKILMNTSSAHFRADFEPIAHAVLVAKAPGPMFADPADLPWTRLARGMRLKPKGRAFGEGRATRFRYADVDRRRVCVSVSRAPAAPWRDPVRRTRNR
jgi:microcystin degradation protein MlrC